MWTIDPYTESIMKAIEEEGHNDHFMECSIYGHKVSDVRLASDTALLSYTKASKILIY